MNQITPPAAPIHSADSSTRKHLRGSMMLLVGRCMALGINLIVQVMTVRYLAKEDFGAFAFGISMVAMLTNLSALGLPKSLARFVPIYHERKESSKALGAVLLVAATVLGIGIAAVAVIFGAVTFYGSTNQVDPETLAILLILIVLAPVESLDRILESLYAASGQVRSIFVRRHLLGPGAKLAAVLLVVWLGGDVRSLATLYVVAGVLGLVFYLSCWRKMSGLFRSQPGDQPRRIKLPVREMFSYSLPLYSSQIGFVMRSSLVVLLLQWYVDSVAVAEFRAVFPFARLNEVVMGSFAIMFVPVASRLFARQETNGINELYWRSSTWILVLSMPVFLLTGVFAPWFTPLVLGEGYAASSWILCVLTSAFFIDAVFGFNLHTLRVYAKVWHIAIIEVISILCSLGLCLVLIPRHGAWGAAVAVSLATITQNVIAQWVMRRTTGVGRMTWKYARFYLSAGVMLVAIVGTQWAYDLPILVSASAAAIAYCVFVWAHRPILCVDDTFPELRKIPLVSRWFSVPSPTEFGTLVEGGR